VGAGEGVEPVSRCPLTEVCKHYQPEGKCCNDEAEARHFCGKYKEALGKIVTDNEMELTLFLEDMMKPRKLP